MCPPDIKHGWLGNPRTKRALKWENHLVTSGIFQLAMFDYQWLPSLEMVPKKISLRSIRFPSPRMIFYLMSKREPILELEILVTEARLMGAAQQIGHLQAPWMPGPTGIPPSGSGFHPHRSGMNLTN